MGIGKASDFVIYQEQFFGGMSEVLEQEANAFGAASQGAIQIVPQRLIGDYEKESFFKVVSGLVTRRDTTSVATAADTALSQGEIVNVKVARKIGPVAQTMDAFRKIGKGNEEISFILGQQMGKAVALDYLNTALSAAVPAVAQVYDVDVSGGAPGTITHTDMVSALAKFGDASGNVVCWVMHSKVYFDLMKQAIADKIYEVAGVTIYSATVASLNRPCLVTDSPALTMAGPKYHTLGLVNGALVIKESEGRDIVSQIVTGLENLVVRLQGEYAFNLGIKGFTWDTAAGGANPTAGAIATATNWDKVATDDKSTAGVRLKTN